MDTTKASRLRHVAGVLLLGVLVATAGCSAIGGSGTPDGNESMTNGTMTEQPATEGPATTPTNGTETGNESGNQTANETESHDDGHDHGGEAGGYTKELPDTETAKVNGLIKVYLGGNPVGLQSASESGSTFWVEEDGTYRTNESNLTLADALSNVGVNATADTLTYNGQTYRDGDGTTVHYRVNGERVDPTTYTLENRDAVWVTVETPEMDGGDPTRYIGPDDLHIHGDIEFVVNGESVDFSEDQYQTASHQKYFHFEGGHADPWHAHSPTVTLQYGMGTLSGINVTEDTVTYQNETYRASDPGTELTIQVNGEEVTPGNYFLKDGDSVRIVVETDSQTNDS